MLELDIEIPPYGEPDSGYYQREQPKPASSQHEETDTGASLYVQSIQQDFSTLPNGTKIVNGLDEYYIESYIDTGGFGHIYRANLNGTPCVLKIAVGQQACAKLLREAEISTQLAKLNLSVHPLRVLVNARIEHDVIGTYLVATMRDLSELGSPLAAALATSNDITTALTILESLLNALEPIHEHEGLRYLHADVSPENILLVALTGNAVFIDFGCAQKLEADGLTGLIEREQFAYNPIYCAPEAHVFVEHGDQTLKLSKSYDVYCLGLILYSLLFEPLTSDDCDHVLVLARNRINQRCRDGIWNRVLCELLLGLFNDCLASDAVYRIPDIPALRTRLSFIQQVVSSYEQASIISGDLASRIYRLHVVERHLPNDLSGELGLLPINENAAQPLQLSPREYQALADFYAVDYITQTINRADRPEQLASVNHLWPRRVIDLMQSLSTTQIASICNIVNRIIDAATAGELFNCDLLPANLFALTGDLHWAKRSVDVADEWFHKAVLDGYLCSSSSIALYDELGYDDPTTYNIKELVQQGKLASFLSRIPVEMVAKLVLDLRYGYRLNPDADIAEKIEDWLGTRG